MSEAEMVEVKTADLIGPALDWAVMYAGWGDGPDWRLIDGALFLIGQRDVRVGMDGIGQEETITPFQPSTRWQDGGPLIESQKLDLLAPEGSTGKWSVVKVWCHGDIESTFPESETPLIAICRAFVESNLGGAVQVPKELMQ